MDTYFEQVKRVIEQKSINKILVANELKKEELQDIPEATYYKCLERMTKSGDLVHLTKGIYYRPEIRDGKMISIKEDDIIDYYIKDSSGVIVGECLYSNWGLTKKCPERMLVYSNNLKENKKNIGNIEIQRMDLQIDSTTRMIIEAFDVLQNYNKIQNMDKHRFMSYMRLFSEKYVDDKTNLVIEKKKYKKSTIAFMERVLSYYGVENSLKQHLSPLSEYKIPTINEMKPEIPLDVLMPLKEYVLRLKQLYQKGLQSVMLYGSYARGDYNADSDIDIFILLDSKVINKEEQRCGLSDLTYEFNSMYELDVKPVVSDDATYYKWMDAYPFYQNIAREGVVLYGVA